MKSTKVKVILIGVVLVGLYGLVIKHVNIGVVSTIFNINTPTPTPFNLNSEKLWRLVNDWREKQGYPSYNTDPKLCDYADDLINNVNLLTDDYLNKYFDNIFNTNLYGFYSLNLPTNSNSEESILQKWISNQDILKRLKDEDNKYSCIKCAGTDCIQLFLKLPRTLPKDELINAVNIYRSSHGVGKLKVNQELCNYANKRLQDMIALYQENNIFEKATHTGGIEADWKSGIIKNYIHGKNAYAENTFPAYCKRQSDGKVIEITSSTDLVESCFDSSPKHKEVLLDPIWTDVCSVGRLPFYIEIFAK